MQIQFDLEGAEQAKIFGMDLVEFHNENFVHAMRQLAKELIKQCGWITTDDLRKIADRYNIQPDHPNAWGVIFRGKTFKAIGFTKSVIASNHARRITKWTLS